MTAATHIPRLGALARWDTEIRAGKRRNMAADFDDLHAAACNEFAAIECERRGDQGRARWFMDRALLRLHGCYGDPDDGDAKHPGPGRRLLAQLRSEAA